jgi:hypothetical protein
MPKFKFTILTTFKDCLSRQVAGAIKIHYSGDQLLNSKNEYNANHLSRVIVEEDAFEKKKKSRQEELRELEERKKWEEFRLGHKSRPKRQRIEKNTVSEDWKNQYKKMKRIEEVVEVYDLSDWWERTEGICIRAGNLKTRLDRDKNRVLRWMETKVIDEVLKDGPNWWLMTIAWAGGDPNQHQVGTMGARYPIKNTPNSRAPGQASQPPSWMEDIEDPFIDLAEETNTKEAKTGEQGARHPITTPNTRVTDQPSLIKGRKLWSDHLTGLVGWWRRVELEGRKEEIIWMKEAKTVVERKKGLESKLSFVRKFFPETNMTPGGTCKLRRREDYTTIQPHLQTTQADANCDLDTRVQPPDTENSAEQISHTTPKRKLNFSDEDFSSSVLFSSTLSPYKRAKFSTNLNFWRQNEQPGSGDMAGPSFRLMKGLEGDNGSGGKEE